MVRTARCSGLLVVLQALWCLAQACKELYVGVFSTRGSGGCAPLPLTHGLALSPPVLGYGTMLIGYGFWA